MPRPKGRPLNKNLPNCKSGAISFSIVRPTNQLKTTCPLPTAHYPLPTAHCYNALHEKRLEVAGFGGPNFMHEEA